MSNQPLHLGQTDIEHNDTKEILTKATGFMDAYDFTLNPYSGCAFGCTYCYAAFFARDTDLRDNWGYWVKVKQNAVDILKRPKQQAKLDGALIYMSSVTDAYQPIESELEITRDILKVMAFGTPMQPDMLGEAPEGHSPKLVVQTRSPDVTRDIDLFKQIFANGGKVQVNMTVTTDDEDVRKTFEPQCPANFRRIDAIQRIHEKGHEAGVQACITMTPLIWTNDPASFADRLQQTGIERFIIQPFKFTGGKFVAQTRDGALKLMAGLLDCQPHPKVIEREYMKRYREARDIIKSTIEPVTGRTIGEEKDGFAPPF